jgi:HK97 family phage portal protein
MPNVPVLSVLAAGLTRKAASPALRPVDQRGGWWSTIRESFAGAWQQNVEVKLDNVLTFPTVFRCISLIASDVAKMRIRLVELTKDGVWVDAENTAYSPVLRKPNRYQNRIQFYTHWMESKLIHGNTVVLKQRDGRRVVTAQYILDWNRVKPLVAPDGSVFYELQSDHLSGLDGSDTIIVPASEVIHDRWNTIHHPLLGTSPIYACGLAATQGLSIQSNSAQFFANGSNPGGILTAPGEILQETADRLKAYWDENFTGRNAGKVAVLGDALKYEAMAVKAVDAQLIEQLKWSAETVCSVFGVPPYKVGVGPVPANNNVEALGQQYYSDCLQIHIESIELCQDEGLELKAPYGTEFDLDDLLRMDQATQVKTLKEATTGGLMKPDEARKKLGFGKVEGGDAVYMQQQNYSLEALAKRDQSDDPFGKAPQPDPAPADDNDEAEKQARAALEAITKGLG